MRVICRGSNVFGFSRQFLLITMNGQSILTVHVLFFSHCHKIIISHNSSYNITCYDTFCL